MKSEKIQNALGEIKDFYIADAHNEAVSKKKQWKRIGGLAACLCLVTVLLLAGSQLFMGKSGSSASYSYDAASSNSVNLAYEETAFDEDTEYESIDKDSMVSGSEAYTDDIKENIILITSDITMETMDFQGTMDAARNLTEKFGGYVENVSSSNYGYSYGNYTLRIPSNQFEAFMEEVADIGHVTYRGENREDVSDSYYDLEGRLLTQQTKLQRLQELLKQASSVEDIITIESEISEVEYLIDSYSGELKHYDSKADYATIYLSIEEVYQYSGENVAPIGFWQRLSNGFRTGWVSFITFLENVAIFLAQAWLYILVLAIATIIVIRIVRRKRT